MVEVIRDMSEGDEGYSVIVDGDEIVLEAQKGAGVTLTIEEADKAAMAAKWETTINLQNGHSAEPEDIVGWSFDGKIVTNGGKHIVSFESDVLEEAVEVAEQQPQSLLEQVRELPDVTKAAKGGKDAIAVYSAESHNRGVSKLMYENDYVLLDAAGMTSGEDDHYLYFIPRDGRRARQEFGSADV